MLTQPAIAMLSMPVEAKYILAQRQALWLCQFLLDTSIKLVNPLPATRDGQIPLWRGSWQDYMTFCHVVSRPDLALATSQLGQYSVNPGKSCWTVLMRIFKCLRGIRDIALTLGRVSDSDTGVLTGHTDATLARDVDDHRSTSSYIFQLSDAVRVISWNS